MECGDVTFTTLPVCLSKFKKPSAADIAPPSYEPILSNPERIFRTPATKVDRN